MAGARFGVMVLAIYLTSAQVVAQAPVTIYIDAAEGADPAVQESRRDIRREFGRRKGFQVVDQLENASVILTVMQRHTRLIEGSITIPGQTVGGITANGVSNTSRTLPETVPVQVEQLVVDAVVRYGSDEHSVSAEDKTSKTTASKITKSVVALIEANRAALER